MAIGFSVPSMVVNFKTSLLA